MLVSLTDAQTTSKHVEHLFNNIMYCFAMSATPLYPILHMLRGAASNHPFAMHMNNLTDPEHDRAFVPLSLLTIMLDPKQRSAGTLVMALDVTRNIGLEA